MDANNRVHQEELQLLIDDLRRMRQQVAVELENRGSDEVLVSADAVPPPTEPLT